MPKLKHYDKLGTARFITFTCYHGRPLLSSPAARDIVVNHIGDLRHKHGIKILAYVVMPEHVHIVLHPPENVELGRIIGQMKARSARELIALYGRDSGLIHCRGRGSETELKAVWQRRCYDHNCRTSETSLEKINYCHNNPVKRGLVSSPEEWQWSSFGWYEGAENVLLEMDEV